MSYYIGHSRRGEPNSPCAGNCPDRGGPDCHTDRCEHGWAQYQHDLKVFKKQKKINSEYARYRRESIHEGMDQQAKEKKRRSNYREIYSKK